MPEQAVIVKFKYGTRDLGPLFELEDQLIAAINAVRAGEFDGNEVATDGSDGSVYMYGPDADKLFEAVRPVLAAATCIHRAVATVRYGPPGDSTRKKEVAFGS
jgi:hypothetical protein